MAWASAKPEAAAPSSMPASPSEALSPADRTSTTLSSAAKATDVLRLKACSGAMAWAGSCSRVLRARMTRAYSAATAPPSSSGVAMGLSNPGCTMAITTAICTMVDTEDSTAPDTAAPMIAGLLLAFWPMAWMVAALDTKPDANPAMGNPYLGPSQRIATWPAALMAMTTTTSLDRAWGLMAPKGPM